MLECWIVSFPLLHHSCIPFPLFVFFEGFFVGVEGVGGLAHFLGQREVLVVQDVSSLLKLFLLFAAEALRHFDLHNDMLVARSVARVANSFSAHPEYFPAFGSCRDFESRIAVDGRHLHLAAEHGDLEGDGDFADDIQIVAFEKFVFVHVEDDVKIAGRSAAPSTFAPTRNPQARTGFNPGWDFHVDRTFVPDESLSVARRAGLADDFARAATGRTRLAKLNESASADHLTCAAAIFAGLFARAGFGAGPFADDAGLVDVDSDFA